MKKDEKDINNFCTKCGNKLGKEDSFCSKCGNKIKNDFSEKNNEQEKPLNNNVENKKINISHKKTKVSDVVRYIFAVLFGLGSLTNISNGNSSGVLELLFSLSLCPFVYDKYLCNYVKNSKTLKIIQIVIPIALFIVFIMVTPNVSTEDNNINSNGSESYYDADTLEEKTKKSVLGNLYTKYQEIEKFEFNSETNKYDFEISYIKEDMTPYLCASDFKFLIEQEKVLGNDNIGTIKFVCKNNEKLIYNVSIDDVASIKFDTVESNMKYYDSNNKKVNTNLKKLKQQIVDDYKKECKSYKYKDVLRNPEKYKGKKAYWFGEITQVVEKTNLESIFRISVTCKKFSYSKEYYCPDTIYVTYYGEKSFIEDDMVKMWGTMDGTQTYTTVLGANMTIPKFDAVYMDLQ